MAAQSRTMRLSLNVSMNSFLFVLHPPPLMHLSKHSIPSVFACPPQHQGFPLDAVQGNESPAATVFRIVPIVTQHHKVSLGHFDLETVFYLVNVWSPLVPRPTPSTVTPTTQEAPGIPSRQTSNPGCIRVPSLVDPARFLVAGFPAASRVYSTPFASPHRRVMCHYRHIDHGWCSQCRPRTDIVGCWCMRHRSVG